MKTNETTFLIQKKYIKLWPKKFKILTFEIKKLGSAPPKVI